MAADGPPGTRGNPTFLGAGAPSTAVDLGIVSAWAADNLLPVFATTSAADADPYKWLGKKCLVTADGIVYRYNGAAWKPWESDWIAYTPTYTNLTVSGGYIKYRFIGGVVRLKFRLPVTSMGTNPTISLPVNMSDALVEHFGGITFIPGAGSDVVGDARKGAAGTVTFYYLFVSGSMVYPNNVTSTAPFTWSSTGTIVGQFDYDPA